MSIHPGGTIGGWVQQAEFCDWYSKLNKCEICCFSHMERVRAGEKTAERASAEASPFTAVWHSDL